MSRDSKGNFHRGEQLAQRLAGETEQALRNSAVVGDRIMPGAVALVRTQTMAVVSSRDRENRRWCSLIFGSPGFLEPSSDRSVLSVAVAADLNDSGDPVWENLGCDPEIVAS